MTTPIYTYETAIQYLADNTDVNGNITLTLEELQDVARQTQTSGPNTTTLLYNNSVVLKNGETVQTWKIAESIGEQSSDVFKTFNNSDAGRLLADIDFADALQQLTSSQAELDGVRSGLISDISLNLAETASGSVWTMTGGTRALDAIDTSSDYFQKELPALLRNTNVRDIKGVQYGLC